MELRQLEYFESVSRLRSYTKAAQELFITQPTITVAIRKLEEELGTKLIERDNKKLNLTEAGLIFLEHSKEILHKVKDTMRVMEDIHSNNKRILMLAFPPAVGAWLWSAIYPDFINDYPNIHIEIQDLGTMEILDAIKDGEIELGFGVFEIVKDSSLEVIAVKEGEAKVLFHSNHRFKNLSEIPIELLADEVYIQYKKNTTFTEKRMIEEFKSKGISPTIMYVKEQSTVYDLVSKGHGFAVTLDDSISMIRDNPNIIAKSFCKRILFHTGLIWDKNKYLSEASRELIKFIVK
jgi:DNA-binding transcriptional LysR family regulator